MAFELLMFNHKMKACQFVPNCRLLETYTFYMLHINPCSKDVLILLITLIKKQYYQQKYLSY